MTLITKPQDLKAPSTIKVLVYGQPGIGKTTFGLSAPRPLLLDFDGGIHRVNPLHQVDTVQISCWEDCTNVLKEDLSEYSTLVIDTVGKMLDFLSAYIIKEDPKMGQKDGSLGLKGYGVRKVKFINWLKQVSIMGKHLVFIAHDKEEKDGDSRLIRPEIGGSSGNDLIKEIDLVGYMEASGKKRTISFDPCERFYGKNTCQLDPVMNIAELKDGNNQALTGIMQTYLSALEGRKAMAEKYTVIMAQIDSYIESLDCEKAVNEALFNIPALNHVWDSKVQAGVLLNKKATALNLKFNKASKRYENV